ncbi:hypothetical protein ONZ45_g6349 [Pleurotus djamor]|nr:hypothetical protein ONZ45_g6349 [Pleurotus djamor]
MPIFNPQASTHLHPSSQKPPIVTLKGSQADAPVAAAHPASPFRANHEGLKRVIVVRRSTVEVASLSIKGHTSSPKFIANKGVLSNLPTQEDCFPVLSRSLLDRSRDNQRVDNGTLDFVSSGGGVTLFAPGSSAPEKLPQSWSWATPSNDITMASMYTVDPFKGMQVLIVNHPQYKGCEGYVVGSYSRVSEITDDSILFLNVNPFIRHTVFTIPMTEDQLREKGSGLPITQAIRLPRRLLAKVSIPPIPERYSTPPLILTEGETLWGSMDIAKGGSSSASADQVAQAPRPSPSKGTKAEKLHWLLDARFKLRKLELIITNTLETEGMTSYRNGRYEGRTGHAVITADLKHDDEPILIKVGTELAHLRIPIKYLKANQSV